MNREINLRAWYKKGYGEKMVYDLTPNTWHRRIPSNAEDCMIFMEYIGINDTTKWDELTEQEEITYLTKGIDTTNWVGKKIYEGDIVWIGGDNLKILTKENVTHICSNYIGEVKINNGVIFIETCDGNIVLDQSNFKIKVLGNIFEHSGLKRKIYETN